MTMQRALDTATRPLLGALGRLLPGLAPMTIEWTEPDWDNREPGPMQLQIRGERTLYCGHTETEILNNIREHHPYPENTLQEWMQSYSSRMEKWDGSKIRTSSIGEFVMDMKRAGMFRTWSDHLGNASYS